MPLVDADRSLTLAEAGLRRLIHRGKDVRRVLSKPDRGFVLPALLRRASSSTKATAPSSISWTGSIPTATPPPQIRAPYIAIMRLFNETLLTALSAAEQLAARPRPRLVRVHRNPARAVPHEGGPCTAGRRLAV